MGDIKLRAGSIAHNVIDIEGNKLPKDIKEKIIYKVLKFVRSAREAKRHYQILVVTLGDAECRFPLISLSDAHQIVCTAEIQFGEDGGLLQG